MLQLHSSFLMIKGSEFSHVLNFFPPESRLCIFDDYTRYYVHGKFSPCYYVLGLKMRIEESYVNDVCCYVKCASTIPVKLYTQRQPGYGMARWLSARYYDVAKALLRGPEYFTTMVFDHPNGEAGCYMEISSSARAKYVALYKKSKFVESYAVLTEWGDFLSRELQNYITEI